MWLQLVVGWCVGSPLVAMLVGKMISGPRVAPISVDPSSGSFGPLVGAGVDRAEPLTGGIAQAA